MNDVVRQIPFLNLALSFIPVLLVLIILYKWSHDYRQKLYALCRMPLQLFLIGYVLAYIFHTENAWIVIGVLLIMVLASSWTALYAIKVSRRLLFTRTLGAITLGGGFSLFITTQIVLRLDPWYQANYMIPLAGMIFATAMNSVSLAAERFVMEIEKGSHYEEARDIALRTSLIPITNSLFVAGLVLIPGIMTGQILSGVSPLIAARYQIMVMCMSFASAGLSSACFVTLLKPQIHNFAIRKN